MSSSLAKKQPGSMATLSGLLFFSILVGCASGNCRKNTVANTDLKPDAGNSVPAVSAPKTGASIGSEATVDRVRVYKYDGSLQCGQGKALSVESMQKDLGPLQVYSATSKADGLMHIMACGTPTGKANVFEIDRKNLQEALKKGFKEWTFE